jgi:carbamoyl-phosphate synthase large subunit
VERSERVMIAGVGGASLGTEIGKSLELAGGYQVYGCDISRTAFGLYHGSFAGTRCVDPENYVPSVLAACRDFGTRYLIAGGEQPMRLLGNAADRLADAGIALLGNDPAVIGLLSDKGETFRLLSGRGISIPRTAPLDGLDALDYVGLPCIVKPATGSGGSVSVFFSVGADEAMHYAEFIRRNGNQPIAQEYIDVVEGEFTIGVLSLPDQRVVGSIALRRDLNSKLSVAYRGRGGLVSSGYSQGRIDQYPDLCDQAEAIASAVGSRGPLNIQGRVRDGTLLPFEINPRFSASTYLRALAGFNEVDLFMKHAVSGEVPERPKIRVGWYLRSLSEQYVADNELK